MKNIIITGATGMIGKGVLLECLDHPMISRVLSIGRTPLKMDYPKLKELLITDFGNYSAVRDQLTDYDACFLWMGVSASGLDEHAYRKITYDFTLAKSMHEANPDMTCIYVSGEGTDSHEKGRAMWERGSRQ